MVKQAVKVVVRTRPTSNFATKNYKIDAAENTVSVKVPKSAEKGIINNQQDSWKFKFDRIMHNASQEDVFAYCGNEIVQSVVEGYNGTIFCYGQTGGGKTFTMAGSPANYKYRGIIPRSVSQLFQEIGTQFDKAVTIRVSYVEIYNELMFDLLSPTPTHDQSGTEISIQDDPRGGILVKGLSKHICATEEDALNMLFEGETNCTIAEHSLNKNSSRSHTIFTIYIESKSRVESSEKIVFSKLNLVDLAGNERTKKTGSAGVTLKEAQYINKSLSFLEQVVLALCERKREHVPYRQSKLTNLLRDGIGGNSKTLMIANVWPEPGFIEETTSTLKFASRMMRVSNEAIINVQLDPQLLIKKYEKEIRELKQELAMHDTLANRGRVTYDPYTSEQQFDIQKMSEQFLTGDLEDVEDISSLRQVREMFHQMRSIYLKIQRKVGESFTYDPKDQSEDQKEREALESRERNLKGEKKGVGETEETRGGFGIGKAPRAAKPTIAVDVGKKKEETKEEADLLEEEFTKQEAVDEEEEEQGARGSGYRKKRAKTIEVPDRQTAFLEYKHEEGSRIEEGIIGNRTDLKDKKIQLKTLTQVINTSKKEIDKLKDMLQIKREQRKGEIGEDDVIDEEEYHYITELKIHKTTYKKNYEGLKTTKHEIYIIQTNIDHLKQQLVSGFEEWYNSKYAAYTTKDIDTAEPQKDDSMLKFPTQEDVDLDALAYIRAKKHVDTLHKVKKIDKIKGKQQVI